MNKRVFVVGVALALGLFAGVSGAFAQVTETDEIHQLRAEINADRQALVAANMGLTDAEGKAFWPVYREYRQAMAKTGDRMQKLIQDYAKAYDTLTPEQAKKMIDEMLDIQKESLKLRTSFVPNFRKVLPEIKVARLLQIENKIDAVISVGLAEAIPLAKAPKAAK